MLARQFLAVAACLLCLACPGRSAAEVPPLVCYCDVFPPYVIDVPGRLAGADVDIVSEVGRRIGVPIEFRRLPWERLKHEIARGRESTVTCAFAFTQTPERASLMEFGKVPLHMTAYTLFVRAADNGIGRLADLRGGVIGVRRGFRLPPEIEAGVRDHLFRTDEVDTDQANFRKLLAGRVTAVLANPDVGRHVLKESAISGVRALDEQLMVTPTFLVFVKGSPAAALLPRIDQALRSMQSDGTYRTIFNKYLAE